MKLTLACLKPFGADGLRCVHNLILAYEEARPKTSASGLIVIPSAAATDKRTWPFFRVIAVGPEVKTGVKPGDRIVFQQAIKLDFAEGTALHLLPENQLLAIQEESTIDDDAQPAIAKLLEYQELGEAMLADLAAAADRARPPGVDEAGANGGATA